MRGVVAYGIKPLLSLYTLYFFSHVQWLEGIYRTLRYPFFIDYQQKDIFLSKWKSKMIDYFCLEEKNDDYLYFRM